MRYKFIILFLLIGFVGKAQVYQIMPQYGYTTFRMNFDSTIQIPTFCGVPRLGSNVTKKGALAFDSCNNRFYYFNPKLQAWDTIKSADASLFVKYSDTAQMLSGYLRKGDTIFLSNRIDQRVKYTDTSAMLAPYFQSIDTVNLRRVTSVGLTMPSAFTVTNSPITTSGTIGVTGAGTASQYVRGDGVLGDFPTATTGGGASVSYYLNGSVNKGTFGGNTYYEMSRTAIIGAGTDFTRTNAQGNGYIAQFITDTITNLLIPAGNWNLEFYFNASSGGGSPSFYVELYKYDGTNFTLISSNSTSPELIAFGTTINPYFSALAVPETILSGTDRLALRIYVNTSGRSITLHTENSHLCQVITTFTTGLTAINGLTKQVQYLAVGTSGTDFNISSAIDTHTFNLPTASATNRGALSSADWTTFNGKVSPSDTANKWITNVFRKTASDSVFFVRGGTNNFAFRDSTGSAGWGLTGNSGTSDATNFLGTTDNQDLVFRRNNVISATIDSSSANFGSTTFGFGTRGTSISTNGITAFGYKALGSNIAIGSTGISNTAFGNRALTANTTGSSCTAIGHNALATNAGINDQTAVGAFSLENAGGGGGGHTALGTFALRNATFGSANTAVGAYSLRDITSQNFNTAMGNQSGLYFGGSTSNILTNSTSSTFIGYQTYAGANSQSNQTVIGQGATGAGSNTVTLGDNNITATYLKGTLGLGRTWTSSAPSVAASALLDMQSTTRGFLQPRMTTTQMNAISTPATGLSVFNTTDSSNYIYRGTGGGWQPLATGNNTFKLDVTGQGRATQGFQATSGAASIPSNCVLMDYLTSSGGGRIAAVAASGNTFLPLFINTGGADGNARVYVGYATTTSSGRSEFMQVNGSVLSQGGFVGRSATGGYLMTFVNTGGATSGIFSAPSNYSNANFPAIGANSIGMTSSIDGGANPMFYIANRFNFQIGTGTNSMKAQIAPTSGNLILQDGGTFTDVSSARLQVNSTTQGFLPPRMTTSERDLIATPAAGLIIYNTSTNKHQGYNGTTWNDFY
jgi:hypothetical protein